MKEERFNLKNTVCKRKSIKNLLVTFDNDTTTQFANFGSVEAFKQAIGFKEFISNTFTMRKAPNSKFQPPEMLDFLLDAQVLGLSRFEHINDLRHAIVTNIEAHDMAPEEIWHFYNKRGTCELWIEELKDGFAVEEASQHTFIRNEAYMLVKAIAYNLMLWFKEATMPEEIKNCRAKTIRRKVLCLPGNIAGNGRYRHIRLAANKWLEMVIKQVKANLERFLYIVVQRLYPIQC